MIILASSSPRRAQILQQLGFEFRIEHPACDEAIHGIPIESIPEELAKRKALEVSARFPKDFVLGSDTLVFCDSKALSKPKNGEEAFEMLKMLKNKTHKVISGVAFCKNNEVLFSNYACTQVIFRDYADSEILNYISTMEYADKAGAYGVQEKGARFVKSINGCFYNVMGLPVALTIDALSCIEHFKEKE
ncbi:MAG: Maf family protein [Fibromonadaceae bacterium]|jgi:septum formation protein|nr:Maf family protein [Fibromonadaceae bacterium]